MEIALTDRPFIVMKVATSLDGMIATRSGDSQWITGPDAREDVHRIRASVDGIVTGIGTVLADDPKLNVRLNDERHRQPAVIVFDSQLRTPADANVLNSNPDTGDRRVIIFHSDDRIDQAKASILKAAGATLQPVSKAKGSGNGLSINNALVQLQSLGFERVMIEAGGRLATSFLTSGVVDRLEWFRAPIVIGGHGQSVFSGLDVDKLTNAVRFIRTNVRGCAEDIWETYERKLQT